MKFAIPYEITGTKIINADSAEAAEAKFHRIPVEHLAIDGNLESYDATLAEPVVPFALVDRLARAGGRT